jgi:HD-GYP domain-containing protein (c-di-GMP phosphodiesterase class II)
MPSNPLGRTDKAAIQPRAFVALNDARILTPITNLVERLAEVDRNLADHSRATAAWSLRIARHMGLQTSDQLAATTVGVLHEIGALIVPNEELQSLSTASDERVMDVQREMRRASLNVMGSIPVLARYIPLVGMLYDDIVPRLPVRIVIVADQLDALLRKWPDRDALPARTALRILESVSGPRYDRHVITCLQSMLIEDRLTAM